MSLADQLRLALIEDGKETIGLSATVARLRAALEFVRDTPYSMVNDSEGLRQSCRHMCKIASDALDNEMRRHINPCNPHEAE